MRWIISFPCWGDRRDIALDGPLDSVLAALEYAGINDALIVINTDRTQELASAMSGCPHEVRFYSVPETIEPGMDTYITFGACHRQAINLAAAGDRVALLCADTTVSLDAFASANRILDAGKQLILCCGPNTLGRAPIAKAQDLLAWALDNLGPMSKQLFWGEGRGAYPYAVYFPHAKGVGFRAFHLHPFAVVKRPDLDFDGITSDIFLSNRFPTSDIHVVTRPDEIAFIERSPATRVRAEGRPVTDRSLVEWATVMSVHYGMRSARHLWHFSHQITLKGEPDPGNQAIADRIIKKISRRWRNHERGQAMRKAVRSWLGLSDETLAH